MRAAGGTSVPLMLDWLMWLSMPKVNAECEKPENKTPFTFIKGECQAQDVQKHNTNIQRKVMPDPNKANSDQIQKPKGTTSTTFESRIRLVSVNVSVLLVACILPDGFRKSMNKWQ